MADDPSSTHPVRRRTFLAVALLTGAAVVSGCTGQTDGASTSTDAAFDFAGSTPLGAVIPADSRQPAPRFGGELLDGSRFDSSDLDGDLAVVNFWGSWCAPCRVETPEFQTVHSDVVDRGVQFLGVDVKDQRQLAQAFVDTVGVTYPSLFDPRGEVALAFRGFPANVVPATILLDRRYRVAAVYVATVPEEDLRAALDLLLAEDPAP